MGNRIGITKVAAKKIGISYEDYIKKINEGLKWCTSCKQWKPREFFGIDKSRGDGLRAPCFDCSRVKYRKSRGLLAPSEKIQQAASNVIRTLIRQGKLPSPDTIPCIDCGKKAEVYHHHLGYNKSHWADVVALCKSCHHKRHWNP